MELIRTELGLTLTDKGMELRGDFGEMLCRIKPEKLVHEKLVRAAKFDAVPNREAVAVDATAGLGEDSLILAAMGYRVIMFERDETIAALLEDALMRAKVDRSSYIRAAADRMELIKGDSIYALKRLDFKPELIYLDPMFPERHKSSLVKKKLQMLQALERPCENEAEIFRAAMEAEPAKIVIKRPIKGGYLADVKPDYSISGKKIRFDCIVRKSVKV